MLEPDEVTRVGACSVWDPFASSRVAASHRTAGKQDTAAAEEREEARRGGGSVRVQCGGGGRGSDPAEEIAVQKVAPTWPES